MLLLALVYLVDPNTWVLSVTCLEPRAKRCRGAVDDVEVEESNAKVQLIGYVEVLERIRAHQGTVPDIDWQDEYHLILCCAMKNGVVALSGARIVSPREREVGKVQGTEVGVAVAGCEGTVASVDCLSAAGECPLVVTVQLYTDTGENFHDSQEQRTCMNDSLFL